MIVKKRLGEGKVSAESVKVESLWSMRSLKTCSLVSGFRASISGEGGHKHLRWHYLKGSDKDPVMCQHQRVFVMQLEVHMQVQNENTENLLSVLYSLCCKFYKMTLQYVVVFIFWLI